MVLVLMLLLAGGTLAQELPLFRTDVALVRLDVQVADANGQPLSGLTQEDFQVFDEGQPAAIRYFGQESDPVDLLLLLDVSGSMRRSVSEMARSARASLRALGPRDEVALLLFARRTELVSGFTPDRAVLEEELTAAVRRNDLGSGTVLNPAILEAAQIMGRRPPRGRRAILIVTDNEGLNYQSPDEQAVAALHDADTVLNAIVVRKGRRPGPPPARANPDFTPFNVFRIAEDTGGEALVSPEAGKPFQLLLERIRSRYSLHIPAAAEGRFRRLRVTLAGPARQRYPRAVLRVRSGYRAGG